MEDARSATHLTGRRAAAGWLKGLTFVAALFVALASLRYVLGADAVPPPLRGNFNRHSFGFAVHIGFASLALALGPWQFVTRLRSARPLLHRRIGYVYCMSCLIAAPAAAWIAPGSVGGPLAAAGFAALAAAWFYTTAMGVARARQGRFVEHRRWMIRSFALTLAGVTLRLYLPFALFGPLPFETAYAAIAWLCWVPNLIGAELLLRRQQARRASDQSSGQRRSLDRARVSAR